MVFEFLEVTENLTELQVLVSIYNLLLMMSIFYVCMVGYKYFLGLIKKGVRRIK